MGNLQLTAWDWIIQKSNISLSILIIFWLYDVAAFFRCQCPSSCLRTWSIRRRKRRKEAHSLLAKNSLDFCLVVRDLWFPNFTHLQFLLISLIKFSYFSFLCTALLSRLDSKLTVNSRTCRHLGKEYLDDNFHQSLLKDSESH